MEPDMTEAMDRPDKQIERLSECASRDACEHTGCMYFDDPDGLRTVLCYIEYLESYVKPLEDEVQNLY